MVSSDTLFTSVEIMPESARRSTYLISVVEDVWEAEFETIALATRALGDIEPRQASVLKRATSNTRRLTVSEIKVLCARLSPTALN